MLTILGRAGLGPAFGAPDGSEPQTHKRQPEEVDQRPEADLRGVDGLAAPGRQVELAALGVGALGICVDRKPRLDARPSCSNST